MGVDQTWWIPSKILITSFSFIYITVSFFFLSFKLFFLLSDREWCCSTSRNAIHTAQVIFRAISVKRVQLCQLQARWTAIPATVHTLGIHHLYYQRKWNKVKSKFLKNIEASNCPANERQVSLICQLISRDNYSIMFLVLCFIFISSLDLANHESCCGSSFTGLCYKSVLIFLIGSVFLFCFVSICQILKKSKRQSPLEFLKLCNEFTWELQHKELPLQVSCMVSHSES